MTAHDTIGARVPFMDLARLHQPLRAEFAEALRDAIDHSSFIGGDAVTSFERNFAGAHGAAHGVGCGSGTDALTLALKATGIGAGDEVIVPAMTFVASAEAVVHAGATPVLADVDPVTLLLTPATVDAVRTARTRAVIPVHLYGHVVPFWHMEDWRSSGLIVIEDAAQAHLAHWQDRPVGQVGHAACFSFYPGKNLGALGDGGLVTTDDADVAANVRSLRDHGSATKYEHSTIGFCSRLDGLQASFLDIKLRHLPAWTAARRAVAQQYRQRLSASLVPWETGAVHHLLVVRVPAAGRSAIQAGLADLGIGTGIHYPRALSQQPATAHWGGPCPAAEQAAAEVLSLPMDPLMTGDEVNRVCDALAALAGSGAATLTPSPTL
ncbi:MAG: hypothetical protein QOG64_1180 [Acidimicrobiaceae bacterium]|nr:hypothetical protein [Acidimicrobiaceae bacterium]